MIAATAKPIEPFDVIGVDPGKHKCAFACFRDGRLALVGSVPSHELLSCGLFGVRGIVEFPRIYPGEPHPRPNDLIDLAAAAGGARDCLKQICRRVDTPYPRDWKGQLKKPVHHRRIWNTLNPIERNIVAQAAGLSPQEIQTKIAEAIEKLARTGKVSKYSWNGHNILDAVGIAAWGIHGKAVDFRLLSR